MIASLSMIVSGLLAGLAIAGFSSPPSEPLLSHLLPQRDFAVDAIPRPWIRALISKKSNVSQPACYEYPDKTSNWPSVSPNGQIKLIYNPETPVNLTCWTSQDRSPQYADQRTRCATTYQSLWFKTSDKCWVPDSSLQLGVGGSSLALQLSDLLIYCPHQLRQTAMMRDQYKWQTYCYKSPSLGAQATPLRSQDTGNVDVACWKSAEDVRGDTTWWQVRSSSLSSEKGCWLPNQVFDPYYFSGNAHECLDK